MNFVLKIVDRVLAVATAIVFMQAPAFIQNYIQLLAGHLAELSWQLDQMRTMAQKSGKSLSELAAKFFQSQDPDISFQGELIEKMIVREEQFTLALRDLSHANPVTKPFLFASHLKWEIMKETWPHFKLGLPLTLEALGWGFFGLVVGYFLFRGLLRLFGGLSRQRSAPS